jgi:iron-sulfur cluster assembly protein
MKALPLNFTEEAVAEVKNIMQNKGIPSEYGLRIGIRGGGCGATFMLGFDKEKTTDEAYMLQNVPVYIDKKHLMYVIDIQVDFEETQEGRGFTFTKV